MGVVITATEVRVDNGTYSIINDVLPSCAATDAIRVDSGTGFPTVRFLKSLVWGEDGGGATSNATTWSDTNLCLTFDATRIIRTRTTNLTSLNITLGTRIAGNGNAASGGNGVTILQAPGTTTAMPIRGVVKLYGCRFAKAYSASNQALQFPNLQSGSEMINTQLDGFTSYVIGSTGAPFDLAYNVDITRPDTATNIVTSFFVTAAERLTIASLRAGETSTFAVASATAGLSFKDPIFLGTQEEILNASGASPNWTLVRPTWPSGSSLFSTAGSTTDPDTGAHEYWRYDVKCVSGSGAAVSGIPVKLTDAQGNVQVNTTTDSSGQIIFGSGLTANMVITVDHYSDGASVYQIRHRSPFLAEINMPSQTGYNDNYFSHRYYFNWPGYETYSKTSGTMEDVSDVFTMSAASSGGSMWVERVVP